MGELSLKTGNRSLLFKESVWLGFLDSHPGCDTWV